MTRGPVSGALPRSACAARDLAGRWLAHLRRDPRGLPVPWINRWGAETVAATRVSWDPHVRRPGIFHDDTGGLPDFTRQNIARQRHAMVGGRCQVCGRDVPWSRRNLVLSGSTVEQIHLGGRPVVAVTEPWLDDRCAAIATLLCPALIRRRHDDDLTVVPVRRAKDVQLIVAVGTLNVGDLDDAEHAHPDHVARLRAAVARGPAAMWVKAVLLTHRVEMAETNTSAVAGVTGHATL